MGWFVDEYNLAQVTVNLNDFAVTPIHVVFEEVKKDAAELKVGVAGSEIVGIVPLEAILLAADYYIEKENLFILEEDQKVRLAAERLGLNAVAPFDPREKIIEYIVAERPQEPLAGLSVRGFVEEVAARSSAPGGGSVSALLAALGTGLGAMVGKLTYGVRKFEDRDATMRTIIPPLHTLTRALIPMIDADTSAFKEYLEGLRMPRDSAKQRAARQAKMEAGLKTAIRVPLKTMQLGDQAWDAMGVLARHGNPASRSDVQVGARALETGIWGAYQNVLINLEGIRDEAFKKDILAQAQAMLARAQDKCAEVLATLDGR
jgi:glutamate formiminotransferase/formiminotetrahydrofolate cyclodeaminase